MEVNFFLHLLLYASISKVSVDHAIEQLEKLPLDLQISLQIHLDLETLFYLQNLVKTTVPNNKNNRGVLKHKENIENFNK